MAHGLQTIQLRSECVTAHSTETKDIWCVQNALLTAYFIVQNVLKAEPKHHTIVT